MQRVNEMLKPPIVGMTYLVPGVTHRIFDRASWFPVMGTKHEDREHIGFAHDHYHPDWRFMPGWAWESAQRPKGSLHGPQRAFGWPLCSTDPINGGILPFGEVEYRRRLCKRIVPVNTIFTTQPGGVALHRAWAGKDAKRGAHGLICPHRGTVLGSVPENADGSITCPLHGLKFCAKTGKSIPTQQAA